MKLSQEERDQILCTLTQNQRDFLNETMTRGRRTMFANALARSKGHHISDDTPFEEVEHLLDSWIYIGYIDAGTVSSDYPCECGRPLRYQHSVQDRSTGEVKKFGIHHLREHTGLDPKVVYDIVKGFDKIDYELDDVLIKKQTGWKLNQALGQIPEDIVLPADIQGHIDHELPLLDRQIQKIRRLIKERKIEAARASLRNRSATDRAFQQSLPLFEPAPSNTFVRQDEPLLGLDDQLQDAILELLISGEGSARRICESLISRRLAPGLRLSSGKPSFYPLVVEFIEHFVASGQCRNISGDYRDRVYEWL